MVKTTKAQRKAIKAIYDRGSKWFGPGYPASYRAFRQTLRGGFDCVMIEAGNMWLGIELDGHTHS